MCGITGYYGQFDNNLLKKMVEKISHRGPDAASSYTFNASNNNYIGLAHTRLSIIDLSESGTQPMTVQCGCCQESGIEDEKKIWLTFNGEIYNFKSLRADLEKRGHRFFSHTDSEVLLHLYREYGADMLHKLNGIFTFAIYDGHTKELFIARDQLGVKPIYYSQTGKGFLFSSELKSILICSDVSREVNPKAIQSYLSFMWSPAPQTMLKNIHKLQPGCAMIIKDACVKREWQYYDIPINAKVSSEPEACIAASLAEEVKKAVDRQLVADVPIGAFLSGGLDSSAIVAMMKNLRPDNPIECYTIRTIGANMEGFSDDLPYAQQVAEHLGVNLNVVDAKPDMIQRLPEMLYYLDEPQADPAPINALLISEQAKKDGLKVLMSGAGGDDIFTGYRRHAALAYDKYWQWMPASLKKLIAKQAQSVLNGSSRGVDRAIVRRLAKLFSSASLSGDDYLASYFYWNTKEVRQQLLSPEISRSHMDMQSCPLQESLSNQIDDDRINRMLFLETKHFLADHNLNYTDRASMTAGIEARVPLLDLELVKYAMQIPSKFKQKGRMGKAIFKKAMEPYLPKEVIYRPKTGFGAPLRQWLHNDLRDLIEDCLSEKSIKNRGFFDYKGVRNFINLDKNGRVDGAYTIFSLLCIELWSRQFLDFSTPRVIN